MTAHRLRILVIGATGKIGEKLTQALRAAGHDVVTPTRKELDLLALPADLFTVADNVDVVYICAAMTRFIDCESNPDAYRVNVDAAVEIARQYRYAKVIYLSSEAVEKALHTNYGLHKALAEQGIRGVCTPTIARLGKVDNNNMEGAVMFLVELAAKPPGLYRWPPG